MVFPYVFVAGNGKGYLIYKVENIANIIAFNISHILCMNENIFIKI